MNGRRTHVCPVNPHKAAALRQLRAGEITIPQAAKLTGAPVSGVIGWMRLARIAIPAEFDRPRRSPAAEVRA